jgi:hypothetical protein
MRDDAGTATMFAAQSAGSTSHEEAGGRKFLRHLAGHYPFQDVAAARWAAAKARA